MDPAQEEFDLMMKEVTEHLANSEHTANLLFEMMPLCDSWDQVTEDKLVDAIGNEGFHANARDEFGNTLLLVASQYHLHEQIGEGSCEWLPPERALHYSTTTRSIH